MLLHVPPSFPTPVRLNERLNAFPLSEKSFLSRQSAPAFSPRFLTAPALLRIMSPGRVPIMQRAVIQKAFIREICAACAPTITSQSAARRVHGIPLDVLYLKSIFFCSDRI